MDINATRTFNFKMDEAEIKSLQREARAFNIGINPKAQVKEDGSIDNMGKDEFLRLLTTQLSHQDPLSPMDNKDFIAQMAQFSSVEQTLNVNKNLSEIKSISLEQNAFDMLGKDVLFVNDLGNMGEGVVKQVSHEGAEKKLVLHVDVAGSTVLVDPADISSVGDLK